MPMLLSLNPTETDNLDRAVRVFTFSKTGQSKLLLSLRRSPWSNGEVCTTALPLKDPREYCMHDYALNMYIRRTE